MEKKTLVYEKYEVEFPYLSFYYSIQGKPYKNQIEIFDMEPAAWQEKEGQTLNNIIFHIGMAIVPYMFVVDDFDEVVVAPYQLLPDDAHFFSHYYMQGLGELRFRNQLDPSKPIQVSSRDNAPLLPPADPIKLGDKALLLNGAGKDSAVMGEMIKYAGLDMVWYTLNPHPAKLAKIAVSGKDTRVSTSMVRLDPQVKDDTRYPGHKPLSALIAFTSVLMAYLSNAKYIVAGNEYSSNFGNIQVGEMEINHQYSKSYAFEKAFFSYVREHVLEEAYYFSLLRPLYELQIAKLFSMYPDYFRVFISCNEGQNKGYWCNSCPKCAFVFLILYPFLSQEQIISIFGEDLFDREVIRTHIKDLCEGKIKPFECVGTQQESQLALAMSLERHPELAGKGYWKEFSSCIGPIDTDRLKEDILYSYDRPNNIPAGLVDAMSRYFGGYLRK